jgi:hypothetical protein
MSIQKITLLVTSFLATVGLVAAVAAPVAVQAAQDPAAAKSLCEGSGGNWNGSSCTKPGEKSLPSVFGTITNVLLFVIGAVSVIVIIIGAIRYVTSSGEQAAIKSAKDTILYAVIGLVVAFLAYAIVNFVTTQFK